MNADAQQLIALGILVLACCYGCSHCERTEAEIQLLKNPPAIEATK